MSRCAWVLCTLAVLMASGARAEEREVLVPEGEPATILDEAKWTLMENTSSVAFSPRGQLLASGGDDGVVRLWELSTGRERQHLQGHTDSVRSIAFSPDGNTLASAGDDGVIALWEVGTGRELKRLEASTSAVRTVTFSPDGKLLASGGEDGTVRLWESGSWHPQRPLEGHTAAVHAVAFSPDGKLLASSGDGGRVRLWDVRARRELPALAGPGHTGSVRAVAFSPDGSTLASGGDDKTIHLWDMRSSRAQAPLKGHVGSVRTLAFSPDGKLLASGGDDKTVRLFDLGTGRELPRPEGHAGLVRSISFSPDGRLLASGGEDKTVLVREVSSGREFRRLEPPIEAVRAVAFSPDQLLLASGGDDGAVRLWDTRTGKERRWLKGHAGPVRALAFSPSGRLLASGGDDGAVRLWEVGTGNALPFLTGHTGSVQALAFHPDEVLLASGGEDKLLRIWGTREGRELRRLEEHSGTVRSIAFTPSGKTLASSGDDKVVLLWDTTTWREYRRLEAHTLPIRSIAINPNGRFLASSGDDGTVRLWQLPTGRELWRLTKHTSPVQSIAFSPDGSTLASGGGDGMVRLWELSWDTGMVRDRPLGGRIGWITSVVFSPDGRSVASGETQGVVRLRSLPKSQASTLPNTPELPIQDAASAPLHGLLRGGRTGWLSHLRGQPLLRHDDGRFLSRVGENRELEAIAPPRPDAAPKLSVRASIATAPGDLGAAGEVIVTVSNAPNAGRAYWLRVEPVDPPPGLLLLPAPTVPRLEAGGSVELRVGLSYLRAEGAPVPVDPLLRLHLVHAFGEGPLTELPIKLLTPELTMVREPRVADETLTFTLKNIGTQATGGLSLVGEFEGHGKRHVSPLQQLGGLAPGGEEPIAVPIPAEVLKAGRFNFKLVASYDRWPRTWTASAPGMKPSTLPYVFYAALALGALLLFGVVHYARVYRNPMVVQTARSPISLKGYPLAHMVAADMALRRARRLDSTITAAGIPVTRWQRALCGAKAPRDAAAAFAEAIGGRLGSSLRAHAWTLSLPPLRLRFARDTAVVVIDGTRLESGEAERLMADVFQEGRGPSQILVLDRTNAQNARQVLEDMPRIRCVVLSADRLRDLLLAEEPVRLLEAAIATQVAVSELSPYQVAGGVKLENLFFGREREVRAIADRSMRNFLVVGQRQMGKSSLLLAVLRRLQARPDLDAHYVELADADLHRRLARERERVPADGSPLPPLEEVAAGVPSRPRVWLIDEADDFISADAKAGYPVLQTMRALAEEGRAYFILAGFWDLYRAVVLDEKQPLRNFGEHLRLEPLDSRSALALVTEPMAALGLQWDSPATPDFLVEQAGRRANLLVLACKALVESLPPDTHVLTREHLERVFREDKDLRDQGRRWRGDHPLHRAVVRQALLLGRPTREEVRQALKARGADIRSVDFDEAMDHRELSYVLVPDGEGRLYCPVPLMQRYIELERGLEVGLSDDLEDLRRRGLSEVPRPV